MEKLLNKENGSLRRLHVFINDVSWNNKMKIERMVNKKLEDLLKKINPNFKPIEQNFNLHINIDKEEEEKSLTNNLEFLKQFDKDSLYLHQALLEITNKFHKIGADVKNVLNTDKIKERNNNFFEENSDAFKTELFKMSEKIDKVIEEYAVEKMRKVIEVKSKREGDVGYNYNAHWLSVDMSHFSDDFLIKNFKNIVDEDNKNSNEENLKLIKEIRFDNLDKEEVKIIFKNINLEDLNQNSLGEIAQQGYISGFPPVTNRLNRISLENKFEDKEVSVELISNIANTYRNEYIRAKNIGFEDIDKTKLFTTTMSKAKESFEENIEYRHRVSNYNLEREPEKISFLRNLNKKVIQFLEEKDLLKDYIDNYKRIKINGEETFNYRGNKVSVTQKLEGLLYMQGVDIDASNAFEKLKEEIKTKNGNIKGNKIK